MESLIFLKGSIIKTALADTGKPAEFNSAGSSIPKFTAKSLDSSAIIGYGKPLSFISPYALISYPEKKVNLLSCVYGYIMRVLLKKKTKYR
jgi:hypothetical protein